MATTTISAMPQGMFKRRICMLKKATFGQTEENRATHAKEFFMPNIVTPFTCPRFTQLGSKHRALPRSLLSQTTTRATAHTSSPATIPLPLLSFLFSLEVLGHDGVHCQLKDIVHARHFFAAAFNIGGAHLPCNILALLLSDGRETLCLE